MQKLLYAIGSVITFLLLYYAAAAIVSLIFIAYYLSHGISNSDTELFNILSQKQGYNIVILAFLLLTIFYVLFYMIKKRKVSELIQAEPVSAAAIVFSALSGFSFYLVQKFSLSFFFGDVQGFHIDLGQMLYSKGPAWDIVKYIAAAMVMLPILEELTHRGILFGVLKRRLSLGWAIFVQSLVYAVMYAEPYIVLYTFALGIIAGAVYQWHRSILLPMIIHLSFNAAAILVSIRSINMLYEGNDSIFFIANSIVLILAFVILFMLSAKTRHRPNIKLVK
jgi:membrane protease YdiL (CAAX protease family)